LREVNVPVVLLITSDTNAAIRRDPAIDIPIACLRGKLSITAAKVLEFILYKDNSDLFVAA